MAVKFVDETLAETPAVRAAVSIYEVVAPDASDKARVVSEIIQIAGKVLRRNLGAKTAATMLVEKFYRNGDTQKIRGKVFDLVKANLKELMNPY